ncbi:N-acetyl-beta-glucosaminyl-glycoprotein 4-beta-N-acetylgalactosaminyltransferase 1 isoform X1 [Lissotriton helveticus]
MLWFPVKKIRKQFRLLLLLVLLTFAIWFTYLHISLVRQGKALRLHFGYGKDGERLAEGTDAGRRMAGAHASSLQRRPEDSSESREEEQVMDGDVLEGKPRHLNVTRKVLPWSEQYKGLVNLHVFEDWCGGAVRQLRKNLHFPLYPHSRTTVKKLAVSPKWKNYGLRLFGYIHPFKDGDFQFAVASDDNSEFWLSTDESPANIRLLAYVGKMGSEWTAPGEFTKFSSQTSRPVRLMTSRRYYFELIHKQDDKGSDHVEVGWRIFLPSLKFEVIDSPHISLYTDESELRMDQVEHIPQSLASHSGSYRWEAQQEVHGIDMLKPDQRDTFFLTPLIEKSRVDNVLVPCAYAPTYIVKDFPIARYQGLQFVYLSFVYPNDFTRLTHMETENKCFYRESPLYLEKFGFYKYMKMDDDEDHRQNIFSFLDSDPLLAEEDDEDAEEGGPESREPTNPPPPKRIPEKRETPSLMIKDYGDDEDDYIFRQTERRFDESVTMDGWQKQETKGLSGPRDATKATDNGVLDEQIHVPSHQQALVGRALSWVPSEDENRVIREHGKLPKHGHSSPQTQQQHVSIPIVISLAKQAANTSTASRSDGKESKKTPRKVYVTRLHPGKSKAPKREPAGFPGMLLYPRTLRRNSQTSKTSERKSANAGENKAGWFANEAVARPSMRKRSAAERRANRRWNRADSRQEPRERVQESIPTMETELFSRERPMLTTTLLAEVQEYNSSDVGLAEGAQVTSFMRMSQVTESQQDEDDEGQTTKEAKEELADYSYEDTDLQQNWLEDTINWQRTFSVTAVDFEMLRSDWNDLRCNVSGNLQLGEGEVVDVVAQYMEKLNSKNGGIYTLQNIVNVEKRRDSARGNRYLIELELLEKGRKTVRLSEYVYVLLHHGKQEDSLETTQEEDEGGARTAGAPTTTESLLQDVSPWSVAYGKPVLCRPTRLSWRHDVMVHFVIPVKNQARWVQQFITDMEVLYRDTGDENFNVILVDFESEDIDVESALKKSKLPGYHYLRKTGNFERSAGLQAGVDTIQDNHSIIFLCDLHIHFPPSLLDGIRKHCVEGKLAYAPIVMRLNCGSSPREPRGYWEVNGFGLFGIYKSDFDRIGGMNTEEFKDHWGGEDWELLDRVLQSGLEVERLRLRNFYHYYHSKRGMWNTRNKKATPKA